jgi:hypothetical protein
MLPVVERNLMDIAGTGHPDVIRPQTLGNPEAPATGEVDQDPPLVGIGARTGLSLSRSPA